MKYVIRKAMVEDISALSELIELSARTLGAGFYTTRQIEAALGTAWGVDSQLIRDGSYFAVYDGPALVGCGGWSRRKALFGADSMARSEPGFLDPVRDSARIRAFFVHPEHARRGIGRMLLARCEAEAKTGGFRSAELVATLPGEQLYAASGYRAAEKIEYLLPGGLTITFVSMRKEPL